MAETGASQEHSQSEMQMGQFRRQAETLPAKRQWISSGRRQHCTDTVVIRNTVSGLRWFGDTGTDVVTVRNIVASLYLCGNSATVAAVIRNAVTDIHWSGNTWTSVAVIRKTVAGCTCPGVLAIKNTDSSYTGLVVL